jgi:nucleoside-diphosphate-sugar epimerase
MNVLVTGGAGCLGGYVMAALEALMEHTTSALTEFSLTFEI